MRVINPSDIRMLYFSTVDVLENKNEKDMRQWKLHRAMMLTHSEHISISLFLRLNNGETVETQSDVIDFGEDYIVIKGGYFIPLRAIVDVDA